MYIRRSILAVGALLLAAISSPAFADEPSAVALPSGVKAVWDLKSAERETTATRERICINGLWRWQPAQADADRPPADNWGYFKVPGCWPGISDYQQKDCQTLFAHPSWKGQSLGGLTSAWYEREITVPREWTDRRIELSLEYLNSFAAVYVDGKKAGEVHFPGGNVEVTGLCRPGEKQVLSLLVIAMPLKGVMLSYKDTNSARQVKGEVSRRGLCGDVLLLGMPGGPRVTDTKVDTSVRRWEITFEAALAGVKAGGRYLLQARVTKAGKTVREFTSPAFKASELKDGRFAFTQHWQPNQLWDTVTPQNTYDVALSLVDADGKLLDAATPVRFGFREFWIDGRDFYLNGTRIFLSAVPLDNAGIGAAWASYAAARESLERLKSFGINFVYTHNYGCEPGSHLSFAEMLRAADDVGMLVAMSQPHFSHYDWKQPDADRTNGYARHAEFYVRQSQNHPSVIAYSMSHNATGYEEDMNPDMIDGTSRPGDQWSRNNVKLAMRAEAIVKRFDPGRIVYHHSSGNLGAMHSTNFYPNFAPVQELDDWFEHWSTTGVKPMFMCEYGAPFSWDWGMYRGWYQGKREWGSAKVPWDFCLAEWNAQFFGDRAYQISDAEKANLRWEAKQWAAGNTWFRWGYPVSFGSPVLTECFPVYAMYLADNWRAYRTWEVSAISPWEHELYWTLRPGVDRGRKDLTVDWDHLQRPGFSADFLDQRYERFDMAYERSDWIPTVAAQALLRNNMPLLAYIAGRSGSFTSKDHVFSPGETVEKQMIVINNSRRTVSCDCQWSLGLPEAVAGHQEVSVETGQQKQIPLKFQLPDALPPGKYELSAKMKFGDGSVQEDSFRIDVVPRAQQPQVAAKIAVFDTKGETSKLLSALGVHFQAVGPDDDLSAFDTLIVGKSCLTVDGPAPSIARVRDGLRVVLFEQAAAVLEQRFGFRVAEYGLREVFPRVPDHPLLTGLGVDDLHDWRGAATLSAPRLTYQGEPMRGPTVSWCGFTVPRLWRCGNKGNVASVLIEKPARGDFLPVVDGGFSLQFSPLLEYREGRGMILFCQLDVTGRSGSDPAAATLVGNILRYVSTWKPAPRRHAAYAGDPAGQKHLESLGIAARPYDGGELQPDEVLIVGRGAGRKLAASSEAIAAWLKAGGHLVAIGLDPSDVATLPLLSVTLHQHEHIAAYFVPPAANSLLAGVGPADVHNRDPRKLPLVVDGATILGDGVLAQNDKANVVICQLAPWDFTGTQQNLKKTFRHTSFLASRILANAGVAGPTPLIDRFHAPLAAKSPEQRWLDGLYVDQPVEWDDPYRHFRW